MILHNPIPRVFFYPGRRLLWWTVTDVARTARGKFIWARLARL